MAVEVTAKLPGDEVPLIAGTVGIFKIPFGFEIGQSDYNRLFAERSNLEKAFFLGEYDLGARLAGGWRFVRYALAVQNGEPLGESTFPGRDPNAAKDVVGRLGMTSALGAGVDFQAGFSALTGKGLHKGTAPSKPTVSWQDTQRGRTRRPERAHSFSGQLGLALAQLQPERAGRRHSHHGSDIEPGQYHGLRRDHVGQESGSCVADGGSLTGRSDATCGSGATTWLWSRTLAGTCRPVSATTSTTLTRTVRIARPRRCFYRARPCRPSGWRWQRG